MSIIHQFSYGASNRREETSGRDLPDPTAKFQNLDNTNFDDVHEGIVQYFNRAGLAKFLNPDYAPLGDEDYDLTQAAERRKLKQEKEQHVAGKLQSMALLQRFIAPTGFAHTATTELFKHDTDGGNFFVIWDLLLNAFEGKTLTAMFSVIRAIIAFIQDGPKGGDVLECIDKGMTVLNKLKRFGPREVNGQPLDIYDHEMSETVRILIVLAVVWTMPEHQEVIDELLKKYVLLAEDQTDFEQVTYEKLMPKLRSLMAADNAKKGTKAESNNTLVSISGGGQHGAGGAPAGTKPTCKACGKKGHEEKDCWVKHPEKKKSFNKKNDPKKSTSGGAHGKHQFHRGGGGRSRGGGRFRGRGQRGGRDGGQRGGGRGHYDPAAPAHERSGAGAYTGNTEVVDYDSDYYSDDRLKYVFSNNTELEGRKSGDYGDGGADYCDGVEVQIHHTMMDPEEEETEGGDSEDEYESEESTISIGAQEKGTLALRASRKSHPNSVGDRSEVSSNSDYEVHNVGATKFPDVGKDFDWFQTSDEKEEKEEGELREAKETAAEREDRIAREYLRSVRPPEDVLLISPSRHQGMHHVRGTYTGEIDTPHPRGIALRFVRSLSQKEREEFLEEVDREDPGINGEVGEESETEEAEVQIDDGHCARSRPRMNTLFRTLDGTEASASTPATGKGNPILKEIESFKQGVQPSQAETEYLEETSDEEEKTNDRPKKRDADEPIGGAEKKDNRDPDDDPAPGGGAAIAGGFAPERVMRAGEVDDRNTDSTGPPSLIEIDEVWRDEVPISGAFPEGTNILDIAYENAIAYGEIRVPLKLRMIADERRTFGRGVYGEYILMDDERCPPRCGPSLQGTIRAMPILRMEEVWRVNERTRDTETVGRIPGVFLNRNGFPRRLPETNPATDPRLAMIRVAPMPREGIRMVPPGHRMPATMTRIRHVTPEHEPELTMVTQGSFYRHFERLEPNESDEEPEGEEKSDDSMDPEVNMIRVQREDRRKDPNENTDILSDSGATHSVVNETFPLLNERPAKGIVKTSNTSEDPNQITGVGEYLFLGRRCKAFRCRGMSKSLLAENDITRQHPITFTRSNGRCVVKDQETGEEHVIETKRGLSVLPLSLINGSA